MKDEIRKHAGHSFLSIQHFVIFIMSIAEFASLVLNRVCLTGGRTHLEHTKRRYCLFPFLRLEFTHLVTGAHALCAALAACGVEADRVETPCVGEGFTLLVERRATKLDLYTVSNRASN